MTRPVQAPTLRRARAAVFALFASFGIVLSTWAVHLPALKQSVGMSNAVTGTVLLILGIGSLAGMQISGVAISRWGTERVAVMAGVALAVSIMVPLAATTIGQAAFGAFVLGTSAGCADVGMNAAAVDVERDYGRPIMAAFHAVFSIGTVIGSLLGVGRVCLAAHHIDDHQHDRIDMSRDCRGCVHRVSRLPRTSRIGFRGNARAAGTS